MSGRMLVASVAAVGMACLAGVACVNRAKQTPAEQLAAEAAEANKQCPMKIDDDTRLDSISAGPGLRIVYSYTAVTSTKDELGDIAEFTANLRGILVETVKTTPEMGRNKKRGVTFVYEYKDMDGQPVTTIEIGPADYRGTETAGSDVDVMVIGTVGFEQVAEAVAAIQDALGREVNPSVYAPDEFKSKVTKKHHFLTDVLKNPKIYLIGDRDGLEGLAGKRLAD